MFLFLNMEPVEMSTGYCLDTVQVIVTVSGVTTTDLSVLFGFLLPSIDRRLAIVSFQ
jgi:hypothetical protein